MNFKIDPIPSPYNPIPIVTYATTTTNHNPSF